MKKSCILLTCAIVILSTGPALSAIKFKRFPHCPDGAVTQKTCECRAGTSKRFRYCHAGDHCDTSTGKCQKHHAGD